MYDHSRFFYKIIGHIINHKYLLYGNNFYNTWFDTFFEIRKRKHEGNGKGKEMGEEMKRNFRKHSFDSKYPPVPRHPKDQVRVSHFK